MTRARSFGYWLLVLGAVVFTVTVSVVVLDAIDARNDQDRQQSELRAAASRRVDLLQQEIARLEQRNIELERQNAVLIERK